MPKDDKKIYKDRTQFINTQQTESYRQQLSKEKRILAAKTKADIEKLHPYFSINNNYLALLKKNPEENNTNAVPYEHPLDTLGQVENEYCQKCSRDRKFCPHKNQARLEQRIEDLKFPMTSTQQIGWRPPIDDTVGKSGYGLKSTIQNYTTSFRSEKKKEQQ